MSDASSNRHSWESQVSCIEAAFLIYHRHFCATGLSGIIQIFTSAQQDSAIHCKTTIDQTIGLPSSSHKFLAISRNKLSLLWSPPPHTFPQATPESKRNANATLGNKRSSNRERYRTRQLCPGHASEFLPMARQHPESK